MESGKEIFEVSKLLSAVKLINKEYEILLKHSGDSFNIFQILGLGTNEVRLHSALLAELLNPAGSHQQGSKYLSLFLTAVGLDDFIPQPNNCTIEIEYHIDLINEDYTKGGRIDILITSSCGETILIENKIYAPDQKNQLLRYKNAFPAAKILYLTLDGRSSSDDDIQSLAPGDYQTISYQTDILGWLELCMEKSVNLPMVRESIRQYINVIRNLTNQTENKNQTMEILELLLESSSSFNSGKMIQNAFRELDKTVNAAEKEVLELWRKQLEKSEILLFKFRDYDFYFKLSMESGFLHFDVFPYLNGKFSVADDAIPQEVRTAAMNYDKINPKLTFFRNVNYTVWVLPKEDFHYREVDYKRYKQLRENKEEWISSVLKEAVEFIEFLEQKMSEMKDASYINMLSETNRKVLEHWMLKTISSPLSI